MEYIIMSKKELYMLSNYSNVNIVANHYDHRMQDDTILIYQNGKIRTIIALNRWVSEFIKQPIDKQRDIRRNSFTCIVLDMNQYDVLSIKELLIRYNKGENTMREKEVKIVEISGEEMTYSDDDLYNINSWGADLSFREIITMYEDEELLKPELQRKYVWSKNEASRFIDSILLGLPVPSIFLAKEKDETMLIIDGFQRIMTVNDFVKGIFSGDGKSFKLSNTDNINKKWRGKTFAELDPEEKRRIRNTTIHAIIFEQKYPRNDTGMFQIFERINTGGRTLKPQEIRNCVYQGKCNDLLFELNKNTAWRKILGTEFEDSRMADLELILRFFAISDLHIREERELKQINLSKYLNQYMGDKTNTTDDDIEKMHDNFTNMIEKTYELFGINAFKNMKKGSDNFANKVNPAIYDAVAIATSYAMKDHVISNYIDYLEKYKKLLQNEEFCFASSNRTTNVDNIRKRIELASLLLYGTEYEW